MSDEMPRFNWGEPDEFGTKPPPEKYLKPGQSALDLPPGIYTVKADDKLTEAIIRSVTKEQPHRTPLPVGDVRELTPRQALNESFATLHYGAVVEFIKIEETDTEIQMILKVVANLERLNGALRKNAEQHREQLDRLAKYDNFLDAAGAIIAEINTRDW